MVKISIAPLIFLACWTAGAQSGGIGPARLTVVYQPADGTLRPVSGVAIANRTGRPIADVPRLTQAVIGYHGAFALGVADSGKLALIQLPNGDRPSMTWLDGLDSPDAILLSPGSQAALVVNSGVATVLTGLEGSLSRQTLGTPLPSSASRLAVADDGSQIAFFAPDQARVVVMATQSPSQVSYPAAAVAAIQFVAGSSDLLFIDAGNYYAVRAGNPVPLAGPAGGAHPVAISSSGDGRFYYLADASGAMLRIDTRDFSSGSFNCSCAISRLTPGPSDGRFQMADASCGFLTFLDWSDQPRLFSIQLPAPEARQ